MTDTIPALHNEAQAIRDDMAEYGLEHQDGRTSVSWNEKVEEWKIRIAFLRDRITPHVKESASIKAARDGAQAMYAHLVGYQQEPNGASIEANLAEWANRIRLYVRDKLV